MSCSDSAIILWKSYCPKLAKIRMGECNVINNWRDLSSSSPPGFCHQVDNLWWDMEWNHMGFNS